MAHTKRKGSYKVQGLPSSMAALCQALGIQMFNIHPGTTSGLCEPEVSMRGIADGINRALAETRGVCVVLENVAGQARAPLLPPALARLSWSSTALLGDAGMPACSGVERKMGAWPLGRLLYARALACLLKTVKMGVMDKFFASQAGHFSVAGRSHMRQNPQTCG